MRRVVAILGLLVLLLCDISHPVDAGEADHVGVHWLPELVIGYRFLASWWPNFPQVLKSPEWRETHKEIARLHRSVQVLHPSGGLPEGFTLSQYTFLVQSDMKGQVYGYAWTKEPEPAYGSLFVTLPANDAAKEIVVISSGVAPQGTMIFGLDTSLHAVLIYDSMYKNTLPPDEPMASIYQVRVRSPEAFELRERLFRPTQGVGGGRVLLLAKGKDGTWRVSTIREGPIRRIR